jgi:hypothetical protein
VWGGADVIVGGGDPDGGDSHGDRDGGDTTTVCFAPNPNSPLFVLRLTLTHHCLFCALRNLFA